MKKELLLLVVFASLGWGFNIADYLSPNESVSNITYVDMVGPEGAYVAYYYNNVPIMIVHNGEIVEDRAVVREVLERYYFNKDFLRDDELAQIMNMTLSFNESRKNLYNKDNIRTYSPPEAYCLQITGLKFKECYDTESCLIACAAVPVCKAAIEGIGEDEKFLEGMKNLQYDVRKLDEDVSIILSTSKSLSGISYEKYNTGIKNSVTGMLEKMKDISKRAENINKNFLFSDLLPASGLQSYCAPVNYSFDIASNLKSDANKYEARLSSLFSVDDLTDELLNRTKERKNLKVLLDTQSEFGARFDAIDKKYNELYAKVIKVSSIVDESSLKEDIEVIKKKRDSARDNIYAGDYNKADVTLKQISVLEDDLEKKIEQYFSKVNKIDGLRESAGKKIIIAEWDIEINNIMLSQQLQDVKKRKEMLDERISLKIKPDEIDNVTNEYSEIVNEIDEIIQVKREHALDTLLNKVVDATNAYSDMLASAYISTTGGTYQQRKQVREFVFPATLVMLDIIGTGAVMAAFIYMVGTGKIRLHRIATLLWSLIFIALFITVAGGSIGVYILINEKSNNSSFDVFYKDLVASKYATVVNDNRNGNVPKECAEMLKKSIEDMNKSVYTYEFNNVGCIMTSAPSGINITGNEKMNIEKCEETIGSMPVIFIRKENTDSTTFSVKYWSTARVYGSDEYIKQCKLGVILGEVQ
ncbi:MAG: hypothetical protein ACP5H8_01975 [Candidatus Micrarchaeia archaeon]